ncbi:MAG: response regulator transcription factor [Dehalococcoidales bacterium]|nr:response regulator transcription factor [Dehalococcoidales bacterium]
MKNTIVLADDHTIFRQALRVMLEDLNFQVVGEASDGQEAINLVNELEPDVVIVDLLMGSMNGLEVTRHVSKENPKTGIVVLSMYKDESYVIESLRAGAKSYIVKDSSTEDLLRGIYEAISGRHYLCSSISEQAILDYSEKTVSNIQEPYDSLSNREKEVMQLVAQGKTSRDIGNLLYVSSRTIDSHRANIMRKLSLKSRSDLIRFSQRRGILPPENALTKA